MKLQVIPVGVFCRFASSLSIQQNLARENQTTYPTVLITEPSVSSCSTCNRATPWTEAAYASRMDAARLKSTTVLIQSPTPR